MPHSLTVVDVNVAPNIVDAVVSVDEDIATTFEIHDFNDSTASDDKDKDRSALTYTITAGNDANLLKAVRQESHSTQIRHLIMRQLRSMN